MKGLELYKLATGSFSDFAKPFRQNDSMFNQAKAFWSQLDSVAWLLLGFAAAVGVCLAVLYYTWYNNQSGRHYKPKYWWAFLVVALIATLVGTLVIELVSAKPVLDGALGIEMKIALLNMLYSFIPYLVVSFVWCNTPLSTNAYRYLKISK